MAKHATWFHVGPTLIHMQVGAAYVSGGDSHQNIGRLFNLCVSNIFFHLDVVRPLVNQDKGWTKVMVRPAA
jgi:hypothetical protein